MMEVHTIYDLGKFDTEDYLRLSTFIQKNYGIHLPLNKLPLVQSRLYKRLHQLGYQSYKDYCDFVLSPDGQKSELVPMMDVISTNKTDFFREAAHFNFIRQNLFLSKDDASKQIKVWSAGCSSGEEAFTLAMVLHELVEEGRIKDYCIHASDISTKVLNKAVKAIYPFESATDIPEQYLKKHVLKSKDGKHIRMDKNLRRKVQFSRMNLMDDIYKNKAQYDLIFCRNTLIYFSKETQEHVVRKLTSHLHTNGYLMIGHSESLLHMRLPLERIKATIYKKTEHKRLSNMEDLI